MGKWSMDYNSNIITSPIGLVNWTSSIFLNMKIMRKLIAMGKSKKNADGFELLIIEQSGPGKKVTSSSFELTQEEVNELARDCDVWRTNKQEPYDYGCLKSYYEKMLDKRLQTKKVKL